MAGRSKKPLPAAAAPSVGDPSAEGGTAAHNRQLDTGRMTSASRNAEIETKLEIDPDTTLPALGKRRRLAAVGIASATEPESFELDATYYDTGELHLLRSRMTLRRRTGGHDAGWHLKLPSAADARTEVTLPLSAGEPGQVPAELAGLVRGAARGLPLIPVARLRNERVIRNLLDNDGGTLIEVADDHVTATPLLPGAGAPSMWRELEAEIVGGNRDQLAATVDVLISAGASKASSASKLARALDFRPPAARRNKMAGEAVLGSIGRQRDLLIAADRGLRDEVAGALHDARLAARRIRAMLTVYSPLFDGAAPELRSALQAFGSTLGIARDISVARSRLLPQLDEEPEEYARVARTRLSDACTQRLTLALTQVRSAIDDPEYYAMLRSLDEFLDRPPLTRRAHRPAPSELPELISISWRRLREQADRALADPGNTAGVHRVRKTAKTVRYSTEAAIGALGSDAAVFASALEEIQETLGEFQDAGFAAELLAELSIEPGTGGTAGFIFGRLHAFEQAIAHGAFDEFSDVWDRVEDGELLADLLR